MSEETLFEHAGGMAGLHRLKDHFYSSVLAGPVLQPQFGAGKPGHVDHLTWFTAESFGGPDRFTRELGVQGRHRESAAEGGQPTGATGERMRTGLGIAVVVVTALMVPRAKTQGEVRLQMTPRRRLDRQPRPGSGSPCRPRSPCEAGTRSR